MPFLVKTFFCSVCFVFIYLLGECNACFRVIPVHNTPLVLGTSLLPVLVTA